MSKESEKETKTLRSLKDLKDVTSMDKIDITDFDLIKGETPEDIKDKCLELCKNYLSGNWRQQTVDTIEVQRVSGGLTNQLYFCGITKPDFTSESVPQEVAIRLYGPKYFNAFDCNGNERLTDVVIGLMVSSNKLGPKIYGVFEGGQIHAFYHHRQFKLDEQKDPKLVTELFQKLARVHALDVPIKKTHWFFNELDRFYAGAYSYIPIDQMAKEMNLETLLKYDTKSEISWIKDLILKTNSPMVFTHNDFRSSNIMVLENNNNLTDTTGADEQIVLCDFEYSSYGYRGHDFGNIINEWGRTINDMGTVHNFPDDSTLISLIDIYREESIRIFGQKFSENPINSVEHILKEIKVFYLGITLFFLFFILNRDENMKDSFPMNDKLVMGFAESMYKNYWLKKNKFIEEKIFD